MNEKPGMFPDCHDGRAVALALIIGVVIIAAIVGVVLYLIFR